MEETFFMYLDVMISQDLVEEGRGTFGNRFSGKGDLENIPSA